MFAHEYVTHVERLVAAVTYYGGRFTRLTEHDDIGGIAHYADEGLVYDILVLPDEQNHKAGRYLFRFIDSHPLHVPSFQLQTDDVDAIIQAMRARDILPHTLTEGAPE